MKQTKVIRHKGSIELKFPSAVPLDHIDAEFMQMQLNRMAVGYYNYGHVRRNTDVANWVKALKERVKLYQKTGNTEWLIDAANYAMIEFMTPQHRKAHFRATSKTESPGAELIDGRRIKGKEDLHQ